MATLYEDVYNPFLDMITDYKLPLLQTSDREKTLLNLMSRSCTKFKRICKRACNIDLSDRDNTLAQFNSTLDDEIIDIINTGMIVEWLKPFYLNDDNMRNILNTNDYKAAASPANMMGAIRDTYNSFKKEFESKMKDYSIIQGKVEDLKSC